MHEDDVWRVIDEQRAGMADLLDELPAEDWNVASLCTGWRVRDVAAHLTLAQMGVLPALVGLIRARGSFDGMIRNTAIRQARLPVEQYAPLLRAMVGSRRKAPGISHLEPLIDILVHGQDITIPLGRNRPVPAAPAAAAAERAWSMGFPFHARRRLTGVRLVATDHDWSVGDGEPVEGPIGMLLMLVTGRTSAALARLTGPGVATLQARSTSAA
jgi:uncharacterized protein (TIGR03083 family)